MIIRFARRPGYLTAILRMFLTVAVSLAGIVVSYAYPYPLSAIALPADASAAIQSAQHQFNSGNYAAAIKTLQSAASQNPNSAEVQYWLGRSYYELHDYDNAITVGENSMEFQSKHCP